MISDNGALVAVADEQQGRLPARDNPMSVSTTETYHVLLCSMDDDDSYGLDSGEHGQHMELCFTAEMSKVFLSEQQHWILDVDRAAATRAYVTAAAERAAVVKEDDLLTEADTQANPVMVSRALYPELKTRFDNQCFRI
eukprot:1238386-Pyramimonas_sp.AAC.1